jgi:fructose-1,6-bisphosphatase
MRSTQTTFAEFLIAERRRFPEASGTLNALLLDIALACKSLSKRVANGALDASIGHHLFLAGGDGSSEKLETIANSLFLRATEWNGHLAGLASEEMSNLHPLPDTQQKGKYLLIFDPLDGSSNIDVNVSVGSAAWWRERDRGGFPPIRTRAGLRWLCDLRSFDDARSYRRYWRTWVHFRPTARRVFPDAPVDELVA